MTNAQAEFSRPVRLDDLPSRGRKLDIKADAAERDAIAARLGIPALDALEGTLTIAPSPGREFLLEGTIRADVLQSCVVTGDPLAQSLTIDVRRRFAEDADDFGTGDDDDEEGIDPDAEERDPIVDGNIDAGEAVVEELALQLPPYPRTPGLEFIDIDAKPSKKTGSEDEKDDDNNPFAALADLKKRLESKE